MLNSEEDRACQSGHPAAKELDLRSPGIGLLRPDGEVAVREELPDDRGSVGRKELINSRRVPRARQASANPTAIHRIHFRP